MTTTELQPSTTEHQPLQRRVRPTAGQATEIPIRWENTGVEEVINVEVSHEQVAVGAINRVGNLRAGRFVSRGAYASEKSEPGPKDEASSVPFIDYAASHVRKAKLGRRLMGMKKWTPAAFEWPKAYAPKHVNDEAKVNSTPNEAYKGKHAAKIGAHVLKLIDAKMAAKAFLGQDGKSTGGKHALRKSGVKPEQPKAAELKGEAVDEVRTPGAHRGNSSGTKNFDLKVGGKHKLGVPESVPKTEFVPAPAEVLPEDPRINRIVTHL